MFSEATAPLRMAPGDNPIAVNKYYIYNVINEITKAMNDRRSLGGLFFHLEKAFDFVNHKILLDEFEFYGVKGKFLELIQSFLQRRRQNVFINKNAAHDGVSSEWMTIAQCSSGHNPIPPAVSYIYM
jgi:hypothetical protein